MLTFAVRKSGWLVLILIAISIHVINRLRQSQDIGNADIASAIRRARTSECRKELSSIAIKLSQDEEFFKNLKLERSCELDSNKLQHIRIGCISNSSSNLIEIEEQVEHLTTCLDSCFSYGHSYGGFTKVTKQCFCGDDQVGIIHHSSDCFQQAKIDWYRVNQGVYYPTKTPLASSSGSQERPIKLAFLLTLSGRSTAQIFRILRNIYSIHHLYYIHVDKRDDFLYNELQLLGKNYENIIVARSRFSTIWGGPSLLRMMIDSIYHLSQYSWDYLINLSESDFPIKPISALESYLKVNKNFIYLKSHKIKGYNFIKKQGLQWNFYQCEDRVWRVGKRKLPKGIIYSGGSDWFALPRDFCEYIADDVGNSSSLVGPLFKLYNHTLLPAESFFHTVAINSKFCDRYHDHNLRVTNWHREQGCKCQHRNVVDWCGCSPLIYRSSDWNKLRRTNSTSNVFFSRKFDPTISLSIINSVESQLIRREPVEELEHYGKRYLLNCYHSNENISSDIRHVMEQFGLLALDQIEHQRADETTLRSVDFVFEDDRSIGFLYQYCEISNCFSLLVRKRTGQSLHNHNEACLNSSGISLRAIEVNHGFDTNERLFRNFFPLNHLSEIVVYHEWLVSFKNVPYNLKYIWIDPEGVIESIQNIKLKPNPKPSRLSFAHKLNTPKPLRSGLWTMTITYKGSTCLSYKFLIFSKSSYHEGSIDLSDFGKFYTVEKSSTKDVTTNAHFPVAGFSH